MIAVYFICIMILQTPRSTPLDSLIPYMASCRSSRQHFLARPARADRRPHEGDHPRAASRRDRSGARGMTAAIPSIALVGNPNAGKSSLFNALTGARQKIANYPGVTVERKAGHASFADGRPLSLIDLPGTSSLTPEIGRAHV